MTHRELIKQMLDALVKKRPPADHPREWNASLHDAIDAAKEYLAAPEQLKPTKNHEWMLTNAFYRMYNHGKNDNPVSAQCEVQALGMFLRGDEMSAWKTSVVVPQPTELSNDSEVVELQVRLATAIQHRDGFRKQLEDLRLDAERYRAVRKATITEDDAFLDELDNHDAPKTEDEFDAIFDAARAALG